MTAVVSVLLMLTGCEVPPRFVEDSSEVDGYLLRSAYRSACVGLDAPDEIVREHTAQRLAEYEHVRVANECLCAALYDAEASEVDTAALRGLASARRDDLAECVLPALEDDGIEAEDRVALVRGIGAMEARAAYRALAELTREDDDPAVRAAAAEALRPSAKGLEVLVTLLASDGDDTVRTAAARGLAGRKDEAAQDALRKALRSDASASTRAAAATSLGERLSATTDKALCEALGSDEDETVQAAVVRAWEGTKRKRAIECIGAAMGRRHESGSVRTAILATLVSSPSPLAAELLCKGIPGWVRNYLRDKIFVDVPGSDIVKAQNDRDYERSYECVQKALRKGGYSCYGKNYLGHWMEELGGSAPTPWCPGMVKE